MVKLKLSKSTIESLRKTQVIKEHKSTQNSSYQSTNESLRKTQVIEAQIKSTEKPSH